MAMLGPYEIALVSRFSVSVVRREPPPWPPAMIRVRPITAHPGHFALDVRRSGHVPAGLQPPSFESNSRMFLPYRTRKYVGVIPAAHGECIDWGSAGPSSQVMESTGRKAEVRPLEPPRR